MTVDVRKIKKNKKTFDSRVLCELGGFARETILKTKKKTHETTELRFRHVPDPGQITPTTLRRGPFI